jgi:hypothetical protein
MTTIVLSNKQRLKLRDLPKLIAEAIHPGPANLIVSGLFKKICNKGDVPRPDLLNDEDWKNLRHIWAHLPEFVSGMPIAEWGKYEEAFKRNANSDCEWMPEPIVDDLSQLTVLREVTIRAQAKDLTCAAIAGKIEPRNELTQAKMDVTSPGQIEVATISFEEFKSYVEPMGIAVTVTQPEKNPPLAAQSAINPQTPHAIPGQMPRTANCKLAIEAAWELEKNNSQHRRPSAKEVMTHLCKWAQMGGKPDTLKSSGKDGRSVNWITSNGQEKNYDIQALGKTLDKWNKSRK